MVEMVVEKGSRERGGGMWGCAGNPGQGSGEVEREHGDITRARLGTGREGATGTTEHRVRSVPLFFFGPDYRVGIDSALPVRRLCESIDVRRRYPLRWGWTAPVDAVLRPPCPAGSGNCWAGCWQRERHHRSRSSKHIANRWDTPQRRGLDPVEPWQLHRRRRPALSPPSWNPTLVPERGRWPLKKKSPPAFYHYCEAGFDSPGTPASHHQARRRGGDRPRC